MPTRLPAPRERDESATDCMNALFAPQRTTERVAQRRNSAALAIAADDMEGLAPLKPVPVESSTSSSGDSSVFASIAEAIRKHDKPLVHIEDDEDGSAVRASSRRAPVMTDYPKEDDFVTRDAALLLPRERTVCSRCALRVARVPQKLGAGVSGIPGGRTLTDADLAVVRAQLRAAAHSSNQRAAQAAEEAAGAPPAKAGAAKGGSESSASAAERPAAAAAPTSRKKGELGSSKGELGAGMGSGAVVSAGVAAQGNGADAAGAGETAAGKGTAAGSGAVVGAARDGASSETSTCAAALETLMWFGMAIGAPAAPGRKQGGGLAHAGGAAAPKGSLTAVGSFVDLEQLSRCFDEFDDRQGGPVDETATDTTLNLAHWDWMQAMNESGLTKGGEEGGDDADDELGSGDGSHGVLASTEAAAAEAAASMEAKYSLTLTVAPADLEAAKLPAAKPRPRGTSVTEDRFGSESSERCTERHSSPSESRSDRGDDAGSLPVGTESWCDMGGAHDGAEADESMAEYRTGALPTRLPSLDFEHCRSSRAFTADPQGRSQRSRSPSERGASEGEMAAVSMNSSRARVQPAARQAPISRQDSYTSNGSSTLTSPTRHTSTALNTALTSRSDADADADADAGAVLGTKRSRSGRQIAPKLTLLEAMEPPLLKWEKEKQQQRDKKNSRGAHHGASLGGAGAKAGTREAGAPYDSDSVDQGLTAPWGDGFVHDVLRASGLTPPALDLLSPPKRPRV
eukprot:jgi/Chrpa1/4160/Chrysochromulina_OHIO_Genome00010533-RA